VVTLKLHFGLSRCSVNGRPASSRHDWPPVDRERGSSDEVGVVGREKQQPYARIVHVADLPIKILAMVFCSALSSFRFPPSNKVGQVFFVSRGIQTQDGLTAEHPLGHEILVRGHLHCFGREFVS
jgi:hypothetical protein